MIINDLESKSSDILMVSLFYSYMEDMNVWSLYVVSVSYRLSKAKNEEKEELAKPKHADYKSKASLSSFNDRGSSKKSMNIRVYVVSMMGPFHMKEDIR